MERELPMAGQVLAIVDFKTTDYGNDRELTKDDEKANCITSMVRDEPSLWPTGVQWHRPVIDIDLPVKAVPSSRAGHFHLFIDRAMTWETYLNLLDAMAAAGIVEPNYVSASRERGYSTVRLPWVRKGE